MKPALFFEFTVDKINNTVNIKREFAANLDLVWEAWTNPEIIDQWWAPKPYRNKTKVMDFRVGGVWLYSMISPTNDVHWCKADYLAIDKRRSYSYIDNFCDENGNVAHKFPNSNWMNVFTANGDTTTVGITIRYESLEALEKVIEMGFKEGLTMCLVQLDEVLPTLTKQ